MAPRETAEDLARRLEHEKRATNRQRETDLESSLAPFRVGSVRYLNAAPLTRGLDDEVLFKTPSELAAMLHTGALAARARAAPRWTGRIERGRGAAELLLA